MTACLFLFVCFFQNCIFHVFLLMENVMVFEQKPFMFFYCEIPQHIYCAKLHVRVHYWFIFIVMNIVKLR